MTVPLMPLSEQKILVTGATAGIGRATAMALARLGADVMVMGRSAARADEVVAAIRREAPGTSPVALTGDFASLAGVQALAEQVRAHWSRLDVLVNNAGGVFTRHARTVDGYERTWAVDHLAPVRLTLDLLPLLRAADAARIVTVSSMVHRGATLDLDLDHQSSERFAMMRAYGQAKLGNILFTYALARRLAGTGITATCLHPGVVASDLARGLPRLLAPVYNLAMRLLALTPEEGAATSVHLASAPELAGVTGRYFEKCRETASSPASHDEALQERLWAVSLQQVGLDPAISLR